MKRRASHAQFSLLAAALLLLSACNLPQKGPTPLPSASAPIASSTPFAMATPPPATATVPDVIVLTVTPGEQQPAPTIPPAAATAVTPSAVYPDTPEGVVQAFIDAYPDDTNAMLQYLSASLKSSLPAGGPGELLNVPGDVNGFVILSGSTVPLPPQAEIQGALQVGTQQVMRTFDLVEENGRWVINGIQ